MSVAKVSIVSQSAQVFMPHIRNGELCSVYGSVGILGSMGNNSMLYLAMMYEEVFLGELFTKGDRSIAFLS